MFDLKDLTENPEKYRESQKRRNADTSMIDEIINSNEMRKKKIAFVENSRSEVKSLSKEIGKIKKGGGDADDLQKQVASLKQKAAYEEEELEKIEADINEKLSVMPNLLQSDIPAGKDESENKEIFKWGSPKTFSFEPKDHATLGEDLGLLDFETAAKVTGSRFVFYKGALARLERALINYMLDQHLEHGYEEMIAPLIVSDKSLFGTGQLPKFKEDLFKIEGKDWYLIPTAEVPLTNFKRDQIFSSKELPIKLCGFTPCFRSEAGSYGKDTRGLIRLHQFNKVEMVNIVDPETSKQAHEDMILRARSILEALELPYRGCLLCSGDTGFGATRTIDLEVWLPSQNTYREISSISNCGDFQARRAKMRYRASDDKKPHFPHTLNGSGLAVGRTVVAILENNQLENGSVEIPEVLRPYMGGLEIIGQ